jgi:hypothetical protein
MEEIIGLLVVLAIGIFKAVNKKFENAGKQPETPSQPFGPFGSLDPFAEDKEVFVPKAEPAAPRREPVTPIPVKPKPVEVKPAPAKPQPMTFDLEGVQRQTKVRKPMLIEEEEKGPKEEIDPKKLVLYSEIMNPKFNE